LLGRPTGGGSGGSANTWEGTRVRAPLAKRTSKKENARQAAARAEEEAKAAEFRKEVEAARKERKRKRLERKRRRNETDEAKVKRLRAEADREARSSSDWRILGYRALPESDAAARAWIVDRMPKGPAHTLVLWLIDNDRRCLFPDTPTARGPKSGCTEIGQLVHAFTVSELGPCDRVLCTFCGEEDGHWARTCPARCDPRSVAAPGFDWRP
jgi:hypothetical protein